MHLNRLLAYTLIILSLLNGFSSEVFSGPDKASVSPDTPWHIMADEVSYDQKKDQYIAIGNVTITKEARKLSADFVRFDHKAMMAYARGHVMMTAGEDLLTGSSLEMNLASETGTLYEGTIFIKENHFYIRGNKLRKTGEKSYAADSASVSSCDGDNPDWKITGRNLNITVEGYGTVQNAALWARQIPVMYSPYLVFPAKTKRQSGFLMPEMGYSERDGVIFSLPFYWATNEHSDATFYIEHIARRGEKIGVEYRYVHDPESKGMMVMDYLGDSQDDKGTQRTNSERYWFRSKHNHSLPSGFNLKLDLDIVSDQDYLREFRSMYMGYNDSNRNFYQYFGRELDDYTDQVRLNRLNASRYWPGYALNAETRWYDNVIARNAGGVDTTLQRLPHVQFSGAKKYFLQTPFLVDFNSEVSNFYRKDGVRGQRADVYPRIYYPLRYKQYFTIEPSVGIRETAWYFEEIDKTSGTGKTRSIYDARLNLSSEMFKVFQINGESVERIKHMILPKITYSFLPENDQSSYPYFDQLDRIRERNLITGSLTNTFVSKHKPSGGIEEKNTDIPLFHSYREFLRFYIEQSYAIRQENITKNEPFLPLYAEVQFEPHQYLMLQADSEWSHSAGSLITRNVGAMISDSRNNRLFIEYRYDMNYTESIYTNVMGSITDRVKAYVDHEHNIKENQRILSGVGLRYMSQCWSVDFRYLDEVDDRKYLFLISLSGLGGFGTGFRAMESYGSRYTIFNVPYQVIRYN